MSSLLQTLYWSANPTFTLTDNSGSGATESRVITSAEAKDALDTTYEGLTAPGDTLVEGSAALRAHRAVDSATASGVIAFIRVYMRARVTKTGGLGTVSGNVQTVLNGVLRASPQGLSASFANYFDQFATDPADSAAWTLAKINAQTFGVDLSALTSDPGTFSTTANARLAEFRVEVWGDLVSTPAVTDTAAVFDAPTSLLGAFASVAPETTTAAVLDAPTSLPGTRTVSAPELATAAALDIDAEGDTTAGKTTGTNVPDSFHPDTITVMAHAVDDGSALVTLRAQVANLGDQRTSTAVSASSSVGPASGTMQVNTGGVAAATVDGSGVISHVVFYALARLRQDAPPTASNGRFRYNGRDENMLALPPSGTYGALAAYGLVQSGAVSTSDGSTPWSWATIFAAMVDLSVRVNYTITVPGNLAQLDVAEVWVEVHGPQGALPTPIEVRQGIGTINKKLRVRTQL